MPNGEDSPARPEETPASVGVLCSRSGQHTGRCVVSGDSACCRMDHVPRSVLQSPIFPQQVDLFASHTKKKSPFFLTRPDQEAGGRIHNSMVQVEVFICFHLPTFPLFSRPASKKPRTQPTFCLIFIYLYFFYDPMLRADFTVDW